MASGSSTELLLKRVPSPLAPPPMLTQPGVNEIASTISIPSSSIIPKAHFTRYRHDSQKRRMPQCIAHRGYKAKYPENTMASFRGAVKVGAHALETDVHITKDDVVVLSHDPSLKRCYGVDRKIKDCTWKEIEGLRTVGSDEIPQHEPMPRLKDILHYLAQPGLEDVWLFLDIKLSNDAEQIMRLLGSTIESAPTSTSSTGSSGKQWQDRVVLGIWAAKYLPFALDYLPDFPVSNIGFSTSYARHFFTVPNVSFNMLLPILIAPGGRQFIRDARSHDREVYAWTVNDADKMEWCIRRRLDGVITDDPAKFLSVCERFDDQQKEKWLKITLRGYWDVWRVFVWVKVMMFFFMKRFMPVASEALIKRDSSPTRD